MRLPQPAALLVEHPAVPIPTVEGLVGEQPAATGSVARDDLSRNERYRLAVQLTAAAALLGEIDLWFSAAAYREAVVTRSTDGIGITLARFPMNLSQIHRRLGGGQLATETMRGAVIDRVASAVGLPAAAVDVARDEPDFFLDGAISRQLSELGTPLDRVTARALWALRWDELPVPEEGEAHYWYVPIPQVASRLAAALWSAERQRARRVRLVPAWSADRLPAFRPEPSGAGLLVVVGALDRAELDTLSSWSEQPGCASVAVGTFPQGWHPPATPGFDSHRLSRHLVVTGASPETVRQVIDERTGRFDPLDLSERSALTELASHRFARPIDGRPPGVRERSPEERLEDVLSLDRDGLPADFVVEHGGLSAGELDRAVAGLSVVERGGRLRLTAGRPLEPAPLHLEVAKLHRRSEPRHALHTALGGGGSEQLATWARTRLDALEGAEVRDLLGLARPGTLGPDLAGLAAEASLSVLDLVNARRAIESLPEAARGPYERWLNAVDRIPGEEPEPVRLADAERAPRAAAETAVRTIARRTRRGLEVGVEREVYEASTQRLAEPIRRRLEIERCHAEEPDCMRDPRWRRRTAGDHEGLIGHVMFRWACSLLDAGRPREARRLLQRINSDRLGPGFKGLIEFELGTAAIDSGDSRRAERHHLRAFRLLQAAGFRRANQMALFNLAVADIDQLRVERAAERFAALTHQEDEAFLTGESCRLALAMGDEESFRRSLARFASLVADDLVPFKQAIAFLRGVAKVLEGSPRAALDDLRSGGQEAEAWTTLAQVLDGQPVGPGQPDSWGVRLAARWLERGEASREVAEEEGAGPLQQAFAVALARRVGDGGFVVDGRTRWRAARTLRNAGLKGWAGRLREEGRRTVVFALAAVVDRQSWNDLEPEMCSAILAELGVGGLEVRGASSSGGGWRLGSGEPGTEVRHGGVVIVPLDGEVSEDPMWSLVKSLLHAYAPAPSGESTGDVGETGFHGSSAAAAAVRLELVELGPSHLPIVLLGETGVGKEVAARAVHRLSRRHGAFVPVNISAIPSHLIEAELFGSVRGAYTGSDRSRQGLVMAAHEGTLFLDEIGDLEPPLQVKLLRFLENQEVRPLGSDHTRSVDVRIVSATNRDLERRVSRGLFRADLFYRLAMCRITIPPLRERPEDIEVLTALFIRLAVDRYGLRPARWSARASETLRRYSWPGNARELQKTVEVALVRAAGTVVRPEHLPIRRLDEEFEVTTWDEAQRVFRRRFLSGALRRHGGNRSATARELGISRQALLYHLRKLGLTEPGKP
ncbi:MAG: sigma 54-interacting transcriptional regulator [Holophagae bacterium]|jgi:DNA-binding NtrC family response regulator